MFLSKTNKKDFLVKIMNFFESADVHAIIWKEKNISSLMPQHLRLGAFGVQIDNMLLIVKYKRTTIYINNNINNIII